MSNESEATHFDDNWTKIDTSAESQFFVRFLDATRARMIAAAKRDPATALAHLALSPGLCVLDVGCGVGDLTAIVARLVAPGGRSVGLDLSEVMINEAKRRIEGNGPKPFFECGDAQQLRFTTGTFDRTMATQLLVHVLDPQLALDELCRVTKRGGLIVLGEMDWDTLVIALDDRALARRFTHMFCDGIRNPLIVRELAGMLRARGIVDLQFLPQTMLFENFEFANEWLLAPAFRRARRSGALSSFEIDGMGEELSRRAAEGRFFAASTFYTIVAKP
ncbi:MAG: hypothetical protein B7Z68_01445 [Acidobacteria bacterium 21-70-11]|nr:MAG: hypothetical protein B7Z68_01445 [Acidobacteria bacterium 21-70-11]OYW06084.1 MAG: hypothetical protein B7Z61_03950 [Acidobacteria bacterium 37-71-11]HQT94894.1 methyltransferase domain-containing protein [Thermoanaerobaculaceae bacterium]